MATNNAINLSNPGVTYYDGAGAFSGVTGVTDLVLTSTGVSTAPIYKASADLHVAKFIVGSGPSANFTTIATAYAAAVSAGGKQTVFIQDGTYTENITLTPGVNLTSFGSSSSQDASGNVIISGTLTMTAAGSCTVYGIQLQTNSAFAVVVSGANACELGFTNCYINALNNTAISFTNSNAASFISLIECNGDVATTGITFYSMSAAGILYIYYTTISNSGASTTSSSNSAGLVFSRYSRAQYAVSNSSTGTTSAVFSTFDTSALNITPITTSGSGSNGFNMCFIIGGSASAVSVGAGTNMQLNLSSISSSNTNAITGAGVVSVSANTFPISQKSNVTSQSGGSVYGLTQGSAPSSGFVGQQIRSFIDTASAVSLVTDTGKTVTSISLTAGIWDVSSILGFLPATGTSVTQLQSSISSTDNTIDSNYGDQSIATSFAAQLELKSTLTIPSFRITLASTTTYYLVAQAQFSISTYTAYGRISATRVG